MGWLSAALLCLLFLCSQASAQQLTTEITSVNDRRVTVLLDPFPIRSNNFGVLLHKSDGSFTSYRAPASRLYLGTVRDYPGAVVAALRKPNGALICRISFENGSEWVSTGPTAGAEVSDPSWKPRWPTTVIPPTTGNSVITVVEVGVDISYASYAAAGSLVDDNIDIAEYSILCANAIYLRDASILHKIGKLVLRTSSNVDPYTSTDTGVLLSKMRELWNGPLVSVVGSTHQLGLVSRIDANGGLGDVGAVAAKAYSSNMADKNNGDFANVWRHEAGHNWGSLHYEGGGQPEGPTVMSDNKLARFSSSELLTILNYKAKIPSFAVPTLAISRPPRANMDTFTIPDSEILTLDVMANDLDANFESLRLVSVSNPTPMGSQAVLSQVGPEMVAYYPSLESTLCGDTFSYQIRNDKAKTATGYAILRPEQTGWWKMEETSGSTVADSSSSGATGTITGAATWDQGLVFAGATTVSLGTKPSLGGTTSFSVTAWVKTSSTSRGLIIQQRSKSTSATNGFNGEYMLYLDPTGRPGLLVFGDNAYQFEFVASSSVNDGQWHHIAAVRAGTQGRIYVDGALSASASGSVKNLDKNIAVFIGSDARDDKDFFTGTMSSVRILNRALSGAEITFLSTFPEAQAGRWKMDETSGTSVFDASGNGAAGTILGSTSWDPSGGLIFQGAGKVSAGTLPSLSGKTSFSIHAWVKVPGGASTTGIIIQQRSPGSSTTSGWNGEYMLSLIDGARPSFMVFGDGAYQFDFSSSARINDGKWHHIIAVRDGTVGRIYIDGLLSASASGPVRSLDKNIGVYMGWDSLDGNKFLVATLRDVRIYNRAFVNPPPKTSSLLVATS